MTQQNDQLLLYKDDLIQRLEQSHLAFDALLARMTQDQLTGLPVVGRWIMRDVLAHFIAHEQHALHEIRLALSGQHVHPDYGDGDAFNEGAVSSRRGETLAEVREAWEVSRRQVVTLVESLADDDFDPFGPVVEALSDTIDGALGNNTYEHYAEHARQIEEALHAPAAPTVRQWRSGHSPSPG